MVQMVLKSTDLTPTSSLSPFSLLPYNVDDEYSKNRIVRCLQRGELNCIFCVFLLLNSHHIFRKNEKSYLDSSSIASILDIYDREPHREAKQIYK